MDTTPSLSVFTRFPYQPVRVDKCKKPGEGNDFDDLVRNMVLLQPEEKSMVHKPDKIQDSDSKAYLKIGSPQECKLWVGFNLSKQLFLRQLNRVMLYLNIVESQIIGNAVTDLLWEVVVDGGQGDPVRYEPAHPHFLPVRERNLESITIQLYSTSGELMRVNHGNTLITLMFSR